MIPYPTISPYFLKIGQLEFRWYGLMYAISFLFGYWLLHRVIKTSKRFSKLKFTDIDLIDLVFFVLLGVILGGRLGYVLFYNAGYYFQHPLEILAVWSGGMSFHGGLLGVIIAGLWFCKKRKVSPLEIGDLLVIGVPVGLGLGRIGNFINGELYGRVTDVGWCMQFPTTLGCRHPSQLYEFFLEGIIIFIVLWILKEKKSMCFRGSLFWMFLLLYGISRIIVEFFREPDTQLGYLFSIFTMGQLLSFPLVLAGIIGLFYSFKKTN